MYVRRFVGKGPWVRELSGLYWVGQGKDLMGCLGSCVKLTDGPLPHRCGTAPLFIQMSNRPGFQIDLFFKLSYLFLPRALESARIVGGIRLV